MKIKITPKQWGIINDVMLTVEGWGEWKGKYSEQLYDDLGNVDWKKGVLSLPDSMYEVETFRTRFSVHVEDQSFADLLAETIECLVDLNDWAPASYSPLIKKLQGSWTPPKPKKSSTYGGRKKEAEQIVRDVVKAGMKVKIDLPFKTSTPDIKMSWHKNRSRSWGGAQYISLAMARYVPQIGKEEESYWFREYAHIKSSPVIGEFESDDWRHTLIAVTCHELAHSLQGQQSKVFHPDAEPFKRAHGDGWRTIYKQLREKLLNNDLHS